MAEQTPEVLAAAKQALRYGAVSGMGAAMEMEREQSARLQKLREKS